jgi:hypothetical protein
MAGALPAVVAAVGWAPAVTGAGAAVPVDSASFE